MLQRRLNLLKVLASVFLFFYMNSVNGFTREIRIFELELMNQLMIWDPVLDPFLQSIETKYTSIALQQTKNFDIYLENKIAFLYHQYQEEVYQFNHYKWLNYTNPSNQETFQDVMSEVQMLRKGHILPRSQCNLFIKMKEVGECLYFQLAQEYRITFSHLSPENLRFQAIDNLLGLYTFMQRLFNSQWYYHSESLAFYTLFEVIPYFRNHVVPTVPRLKEEIDATTLRIIMLLSEIQRVRSNLEASTWLSLLHMRMVIHQYPHIEETFPLSVAKQLSIRQLRILLTIPVLPPSTELSINNRKQIIDDLSTFQNFLTTNGITLSLSEVVEEISATPFHMAHQGLNDLEFQLTYARTLTTLCPELSYLSTEVQPSISSDIIPQSSQVYRMKIGFLSTHFFDHSIGRMLIELIVMMKEDIRGKTVQNVEVEPEVFVYFIDFSYDPIKREGKQDHIIELFNTRIGDHFIRFSGSIESIQSYIAHDHLDILIFADLGMDLKSYALAFARLATYQIAWWGHPITSGLETIDYFFSIEDELLTANEHYSEQLVRMDKINTIPIISKHVNWDQRSKYYEEVGFPPNSKFAVILGRVFKFHPDFEKIILDILIQLDEFHEQCVLKRSDCPHYFIVAFAEKIFDYNRLFIDRLNDRLSSVVTNITLSDKKRILERLQLLQYSKYYHELSLYAEVALDSFPYGGCVTTHDTLHFGLPIISLPSDYIRGRFTLGMYRQMEILDTIAQNQIDYVQKVLLLLTNQTHRDELTLRVQLAFQTKLKQNYEVATEWFSFLIRLIYSGQ